MKDLEIEKFYKKINKEDEEKITKPRIFNIYKNKIDFKCKIGSVENLIGIHKYIFKDFYGKFAGLIRDKNISKGSIKFCLSEYILGNIEQINNKPNNTFEDIIDKYSDINMLHPFFEGNGRSGRVWLDLTLRDNIGYIVNWQNISKEEYLECIIKSIYDIEPLKNLIETNLTSNFEDNDIYLNGVDASYSIENMNLYKTKDLIK